jgi:uncharacterized membrane protein/protein-disulfide isomerase
MADSLSPAWRKPRQGAIRLARLTALVAVGIAGYLLWASLVASGHVAGCGEDAGTDCTSVLLSRWSSWIGLPVGLPAVVVYLSLLVFLFCIGPGLAPRTQRAAWGILVTLATLSAGAALWFSGLQFCVLKSVCPYCMALHACGLALATFVFWYAPVRWRQKPAAVADPVSLNPSSGVVLILIGFVGIGALIGGQIAIEPPAPGLQITPATALQISNSDGQQGKVVGCTGTVGASGGPTSAAPSAAAKASSPIPPQDEWWTTAVLHRPISLAGDRATVDANEIPIVGDPGAKIVVVEVFDYTCPQCRSLHHHLQEALARYGSQVALALLPTPMNASCNRYVQATKTPHELACEYARLALAVWFARPAAFVEYHNWLMAPLEPPPLADARKRAAELLGRQSLEAALADSRIDQQLGDDARLYHLLDQGAIPKLLVSGSVLVGSPDTTDKLCEALEKYSDLRK